jgi:quercetin dioxygenase-like cupin family protein
MADNVRRVVTMQNESGGAIAADVELQCVDMGGGAKVFEIWRAPLPDGEEAGGSDWSLYPPTGGSVFRIAEFPPAVPGEEPFMHLTPTIDYGVILEGELSLVMDSEEVVLKTGDVFVQRQANHGWINRGSQRVRMAVVLIDGNS